MSKRPSRIVSIAALTVITLFAPPLFRIAVDGDVWARDWRSASLTPAGFAPQPGAHAPAVVQAYAASVVGWRGAVADHCWIAVKAAGADHYRRYEVIGYRLGRTGSALVESDTAAPDQKWYGSQPRLLQDIRGADAEKIIAALPAAVASYPYAKTYRMWPGPNSNTFIAHVAREIPALRLALPGTAIGKDYTGFSVLTSAPSGTGFQISLGGLFGVTLAGKEGLEVNILGLVVGANPMALAITLPGFGRIPSRSNWTHGQDNDLDRTAQ